MPTLEGIVIILLGIHFFFRHPDRLFPLLMFHRTLKPLRSSLRVQSGYSPYYVVAIPSDTPGNHSTSGTLSPETARVFCLSGSSLHLWSSVYVLRFFCHCSFLAFPSTTRAWASMLDSGIALASAGAGKLRASGPTVI